MAAAAWAMNAGASDSSLGTVVITAADDVLTLAAHGLEDGDLVAFDTLTGGAVGVLEEQVHYYVRSVTTDTFQVSGSRGGNVIAFGSDGGAAVYAAAPEYPAETLRQIGSHLMFHGSANRLGARQGVRPGGGDPVSVSGTTWTVETHTGTVEPGETTTQGPYTYVCTETSGSLNPADATNARIDALDLQIQDDDADASGFRRARVVYTAGNAAGTPVPPTATDNALRVGTILVPASGSGDPSVDSLAAWTVASGGVLPVRDDTERPTTGRHDMMLVARQDTGALEAWREGDAAWSVMAAAGGFQLLGREVFTSTGSFAKADWPGIRAVHVEVQAAGGGGGGTNATGAGEAGVGSGGGAGEYRRGWVLESSLSSSTTVTIGAAGAGGVDGDDNGTDAGSSSFGAHVVCNGGTGGLSTDVGGGHLVVAAGNGGSGGSGGYLTIIGGDGGNGYRGGGFVCGALYGGASHLGASQRGNGTTAGGSGGTGSAWGGGGAGGHNNQSRATSAAGGNGGPAIVIIEVYG